MCVVTSVFYVQLNFLCAADEIHLFKNGSYLVMELGTRGTLQVTSTLFSICMLMRT